MRIAVLGPLEVLTDDLAPVPVPGAKERLLLAVLAAGAPGAVSTDALAESLWDGDPPATARKSLQVHVVRLRSSLEPDRPRAPPGVRRARGAGLRPDRRPRLHRRSPDRRSGGAGARPSGLRSSLRRPNGELRAAVDLWRGEPYADWPDAPFADVERRRLAEVHAGAVAGLWRRGSSWAGTPRSSPSWNAWSPRTRCARTGGACRCWPSTAPAGRPTPSRPVGASGHCSPTNSAPTRARAAGHGGGDPGAGPRARARPRAAPQPVGRRGGPGPRLCPYKGLAAYQVGRRAAVPRPAAAGLGLVARLVDAPSSWSPGRAARESPPRSAPGCSRPWPTARSRAARPGGR